MSHLKVIAFSGPPCSGKSELAHHLHRKMPDCKLFAMDSIRQDLFPVSAQSPEHRQAAYDEMHNRAKIALQGGASVIVDATYGPRHHRQALERVVQGAGASLYVIECVVSPASAAKRFRKRELGHAAVDLTPIKVWESAAKFQFTRLGLLVDTVQLDKPTCLQSVEHYIEHGSPVSRFSWGADLGSTAGPQSGLPKKEALVDEKYISYRSRNSALRRYYGLIGIICLAIIFGGLGLFPAIINRFLRHLQDGFFAEWGSYWLALGGLLGAIAISWDFLRRPYRNNRTRIDVGKIPRYEPYENTRPSDQCLFDLYCAICSAPSRFLIDGVPIYFLIPPRPPFDVSVDLSGPAFDHNELAERAAQLGLDWKAFCQWWRHEKREQYFRYADDASLRYCKLDSVGRFFRMQVGRCTWEDYLCTDLAANLTGQSFQDMRRLFEGEIWKNSAVGDSPNLELSPRYSLLVGTTTLVATRDGYLILQRRSRHVSEGGGGLGATASGGALWKDIRSSSRNSLARSAIRELREETSIGQNRLRVYDRGRVSRTLGAIYGAKAMFIGAGFNLLHGRDLNFYGFLTTNLSTRHINFVRPDAEDRWEVASLTPVPIKSIDDEGRFTGDFCHLTPQCNRHLRAALYCLAKSGELQKLRIRD